jgi:excisionase family DNA binding protein
MAWSLIEALEKHQGLMTVAEAAKLRRCSRKTIYKKVELREIPSVNFGDTTEQVLIDPSVWKYVLLKRDPMLREAHRKG